MRENQTLNMNYMKINNFNIVFHMLETNGNDFNPWILVFLMGPFFGPPIFLRYRVRVRVQFLDNANFFQQVRFDCRWGF